MARPPAPHRWHLFCRVIDNFGDAGVCWRLARQLAAEHGRHVTLWIDNLPALGRLAPDTAIGIGPHDGVVVHHWDGADAFAALPADVVVGAFAADLPQAVRASMRTRPTPPVWINLEYLSAEPWVAEHHGLPSPKPDGLVEHFFFPGFTRDTGGLLREAGLIERRDRFLADATARAGWLASLGVVPHEGERLLSLFCYPDARVPSLLDALALTGERWRVLVPAGVAAGVMSGDVSGAAPAVAPALAPIPATGAGAGATPRPAIQRIPFVAQQHYDRLLWCCDANLVRGEDSFVRALWSGRPFLWQAYPQAHRAHLPKVEAFIGRWLEDARPHGEASEAFLRAHRAWNDSGGGARNDAPACPNALLRWLGHGVELAAAARRWGDAHGRIAEDMASRLVRFAADRL
jgi:uncharacterized repeat protein (TIGR03837 family)